MSVGVILLLLVVVVVIVVGSSSVSRSNIIIISSSSNSSSGSSSSIVIAGGIFVQFVQTVLRTLQNTSPVMKTDKWMPYREILVVYCKNHK